MLASLVYIHIFQIMLGLSEIGQSLLDATSFIENIAQGILDAANKVLLFAEKATQGEVLI